MGEYAEYALADYYRGGIRHIPPTDITEFKKVACPLCGKLVGGKSGFWGEMGRLEGVHQHLKFFHGISKLKVREGILKISGEIKPEERE